MQTTILPKKVLVDKISTTETESIAENFNKYFTQIGPKLAKDIGTSTKSFNEYIKKHDTTQTGYDDISFNVVKKCFGVLHKPLLHIFNLSLQTGIFPGKLKIARITPLLKGGENYELGNYRPTSVLPCF